MIDALAVYKDAEGEIEVEHLSNLTQDEAIEVGSKVGALIGLGIEGEEGMVAGAEAGAEAAEDGVDVFSDDDAWDVIEEIPNDSAAALILLEHHWAVPLATRSRAPAASGSPTASSARSTWSRSGWSRPRRRSSSTPMETGRGAPATLTRGPHVRIPQGRPPHRAPPGTTSLPPPVAPSRVPAGGRQPITRRNENEP